MPLSRLDNFLKNVRGNTIYVNPQDLDATDDTTNTGNSMGKPFKTIQRALIEASRFSYQKGFTNDRFGKTTIILGAGDHYIDNRPGWIPDGANNFRLRSGVTSNDFSELTNTTKYDINDETNILYKVNSIYGGVIVPRGTSIIAEDVKKTRIRPLYIPNPLNKDIETSAIFRITGGCYIANFSIMDADPNDLVYNDYTLIKVDPAYSHHKLTAFEYADGVNPTRIDDEFQTFFTERTDLDMYYEKIGLLYGQLSGREIKPDYPDPDVDIQTKVDEYRIVGPISGVVGVTSVRSGSGSVPSPIITVTLEEGIDGLDTDSAIIVDGVSDPLYNGSYIVQSVEVQDANGATTQFTYEVPVTPTNGLPPVSGSTVTLDIDTITGSEPFIESVTLRSVYGMCGAHADGSKVEGFKSMSFNEFTGIGLQKDDNAFVKFNSSSGTFDDSTSVDNIHADANAKYKPEYYNYHIKASNRAFCQVTSNFSVGYSRQLVAESGGEFSVSASNSNYGQTALSASGFRNEAFQKDDVGSITNIIPPVVVDPSSLNIEYGSIDVTQTIGVANTSRLYLYQETNQDSVPPTVIQGYRIGAKSDDRLLVNIARSGTPTLYFSRIIMPNTAYGTNEVTSVKVTEVGRNVGTGNSITSNTLTFKENHQFLNGESIRIISDNARLPDGLTSNQIYFAITSGVDPNQIQIAATPNDSINAVPVTINNLGGNLTVESRVSDKVCGDIGHPVQFDETVGQWYVNVATDSTENTIYNTITDLGVSGLGEATPRTFITRTPASRGLDDTIYRLRYVIPAGSGITSARPPRETFVISLSNNVTGATDTEVEYAYNPGSVTLNNESDMRNFSFIRKTGWNNGTASYTTELPHNLSVGAKVKINNVISTNNTTGVAGSAYNGEFTVTGITSANQFEVAGTTYNPGLFTNDTSNRITTLPTFQKLTGNVNFYIYDVNQVSEYVAGEQDGVYYLTGLAADNVPQVTPFNDSDKFAFSQPVVDMYPQFDRDNPISDLKSSTSYALPNPLGEVVVDDLKNSVTKESIQKLFADTGVGVAITDIISTSSDNHVIHTGFDHGLKRITSVSIASSGVGYGNSTGATEYLYNASLIGSSTGFNATARVTVNVQGQLTDVEIMSGGTGYQVGDTLSVTGIAVTTGITTGTVTVTSVYDNIGDSVTVTGVSSASYQPYNTVYTITGISSINSINVTSAESISDFTTIGIGSELTSSASAYTSGRVLNVSSIVYNNDVGLATVTTTESHGYRVGNSIRISGSSETKFNDLFAITQNVGLSTFVVNVGINTVALTPSGTMKVYQSGLNPQNGAVGSYDERFGGRSLNIYAGITTSLNTAIINSTTDEVEIQNIQNTDFKIGDYLRIDDEIMRIKTTVTGNPVSVFRGLFGTQSSTHEEGAIIRRIVVPAVELRKPSIIKASGHTFEYIGYGPGNYSTARPERQDEAPTQNEQLLSQSLRANGGQNVYVGMNDVGDYYIGNKKISSSTGRETIFDTPLPTITGQDPSSVNVEEQFSKTDSDEVTVSRDLIVEGGPNSDIISEFNGPVLFTQKITSTSDDGIEADSLFLQGNTNISRKYTVGIAKPSLAGNPGDIVYNANPEAGGTIGWCYTIENGWYTWGAISASDDENLMFFDRLGVSTNNLESSGVKAIFQVGSGSSIFHRQEDGRVGLGTTANGAGLRVNPDLGNIVGKFVGDGSGLTNINSTTNWKISDDNIGIYPIEGKKVGIGQTQPTSDFELQVGTPSAGTNDLLVSNNSRFDGPSVFTSSVNITGLLTSTDFNLNDPSSGDINTNTLIANDIEVGNNVISIKTGGGVAIGREDARASLDVDGSARFKTYFEVSTSVSSSANVVVLDLSAAQTFEHVTTEDVNRFTLTNVPTGSTTTFTIKITQGSTPRTVDILDFRQNDGTSIPVFWNGNVLPTVTPAAGAVDVYSFVTFDGGTTLYGVVSGQNFGNTGTDATPDDGLSYDVITKTVTVTENLNVIKDATFGEDITCRNLTASQNITGVNVEAASDSKLKSNITTIENALEILNQIEGVSFTWNDTGEESLGVIAQNVESVLPQLVHEYNERKNVNYNGLTGLLIECVKQLSKRVEELENK